VNFLLQNKKNQSNLIVLIVSRGMQSSNPTNVESRPDTMQSTKSRPCQDLGIMRIQWDAAELQKPCCNNCIDKSESVLHNLNDGPDDEVGELPSPKPIGHRRLQEQSLSMIIGIGSQQSSIIVTRPAHNSRSSHNRSLGISGLDSERKPETRYNLVDRCMEFDELLQDL
jgi:hypothetical protein